MTPLVVSFSGGLTSAYMSKRLRDSGEYDTCFVFANTGLEHPATLEFVRRCDVEFGLNVVWLEAVVNPKHGVGITHRIVSFDTASRWGEPFEAFVAKSGIPNANKPQCSDRLKALTIESYKRSVGLSGCLHAIGIRKDESRRRSKSAAKYNLCYPLLDWPEFAADKLDVVDFWEAMPFTLGIEPHEGNCETCWKKSDKKLWLLALEHPERFIFMMEMERLYENVKPNDDGQRRVFFRRNRSALDILREAAEFDPKTLRKLIGADVEDGAGCSESCEAYNGDAL